MSMIEIYKSIESVSKTPNVDSSFVTFVYDHYNEVKARATTKVYDPMDIYQYRYRPIEFLESESIPANILWVFLWINDIPTVADFVDMTELLIPDSGYMITLRDKWLNAQSAKKRANS